jgi:hypothetical protein
MVEIAHEVNPMRARAHPTFIVSAFSFRGLAGVSRSSEIRQRRVREIWETSPIAIWKVVRMKCLLALFLLVCFVLIARLIDVLAAIFGRQTEAVDFVDAWFRNSNSRLLR